MPSVSDSHTSCQYHVITCSSIIISPFRLSPKYYHFVQQRGLSILFFFFPVFLFFFVGFICFTSIAAAILLCENFLTVGYNLTCNWAGFELVIPRLVERRVTALLHRVVLVVLSQFFHELHSTSYCSFFHIALLLICVFVDPNTAALFVLSYVCCIVLHFKPSIQQAHSFSYQKGRRHPAIGSHQYCCALIQTAVILVVIGCDGTM